MRIGLLVAAAVLILDQISKVILLDVMRPEGVIGAPFFSDKIVQVLPFFNFRMAWNTGISFSMFDGGGATTYILIAVQMAVVAGAIWWLRSMTGAFIQTAFGLIIGGGIGNIIDRIRWGAVADFFDFHVAGWHFATFNVADSCISIGVGLWLLDALFNHGQHKTDNKEPS